MRSKNSKPIDALEEAYLADVKSVGCVFCPHTGVTEAHHPKGCQGLHYNTISACHECHELRVWHYCGMTEMQAMNETRARVEEKRTGLLRGTLSWKTMNKHAGKALDKRSTRTPTKIIPRAV